MKNQNSLSIFIFLLVASLFLYFISIISSLSLINRYGRLLSLAFFAISLLGLFLSSLKKKRSFSRYYYIALFLILLVILAIHIFSAGISAILQLYLILAILVALLISLLDYRSNVLAKKKLAEFEGEKTKLQEKADKLENDLRKQKSLSETQKAELKKQSNKKLNELNKKLDSLKDQNKKLAQKGKTISGFTKTNKLLESRLARSRKETEKEAELKRAYSKTIRSARKRKKEEEELLVVSSDGKSVHRPKCITIRNVPKDNRKLIKNWKAAEKEGYKGCKLCKPHIKPKVIVKGNVKYKFVGSRSSDKVHKVSCLLIKNIDNKDREYFRTYRAALKGKYTACRVCNPEQ